MNNNQIGTIHLSGEDAISFNKSFFYPSKEEIERHNAKIKQINNNISIKSSTDGFEAEVKDLDLSFLEDRTKKEQHIVVVRVCIKNKKELFSNTGSDVRQVIVEPTVNKELNSCDATNLINIAA